MSISSFLKKIFNHKKQIIELDRDDKQAVLKDDKSFSIMKMLKESNTLLVENPLDNINFSYLNDETRKQMIQSVSFNRWRLTDKEKIYERLSSDILLYKLYWTINQYLEDNEKIVKGNENLIVLILTNIKKSIDIKPNLDIYNCTCDIKLFDFDLINDLICNDVVKLIKEVCKIYTKYIFYRLDLNTYISNCLGNLAYNENSMIEMKDELNKRIDNYEGVISENIVNDLIDIVNMSL